MMLKTIEEISPTKKRLRIEIPPQTIEKEISDSLQKLRQRAKIAGFRAGKAPMGLIEKKFGKDVEGEVLQKLIPKIYSETIREAQLKPVDDPVFEEMGDFKRLEPFNMTLLVEVMPKIDGLNYTGIKVREVDTDVQDKDVEDVLGRLREEKAVYEPSEGPLVEGDMAIMDYRFSGGGEGDEKAFESQVFKVGSENMPPDFSRGLAGRKKGESFDITVEFPGDYPLKDMAGRQVVFHITLKDAKKVKLPAVDDELAKDIGRENLEDLKVHIREQVLKSKKQTVLRMQKAELMKKLVESHEFDAPETLVGKELSGLVEEAAARGGKDADLQALREGLRETARRNVKASLLLELIGEREKVGVSEEDLKKKIAELALRLSITPENVIKYYVSRDGSLEGLRHAVFEEKVMDLVLEKAQFEKVDK
ncbi:MAG: trigger factor [Nitrospiraceae bacterium]|nr:trigger factor [Nitrospiraceae bacterium]